MTERLEWQPIATDPNDGAYRFYGLHVTGPTGYTWFEAHYVALDDTGQLLLASGDNFDDWAYDDFEVWSPAPPQPRADGVSEQETK